MITKREAQGGGKAVIIKNKEAREGSRGREERRAKPTDERWISLVKEEA